MEVRRISSFPFNKPKIMHDYSTKDPSQTLIFELIKALKSVPDYGSIEIFVQNGIVTQVTVRNIKKTSGKNSNDLVDKN